MSNSIHSQDPASLKPEAIERLRSIDLRERLIGLLAPIYCTDHKGLLEAVKTVEKYVETGA